MRCWNLIMVRTGLTRRNFMDFRSWITVCRSDTSDNQMYSVQELSNGELSHSHLCHILAVPLFITWCYEYYWDFSQHQVQSWCREMAGHMMDQWCDRDSKAAWYLRLEITYCKLLQPYCFFFVKPVTPVRMSGSRINKGHTVTCCASTGKLKQSIFNRMVWQPTETWIPRTIRSGYRTSIIFLEVWGKTQLPQTGWYKD